MGDERITQEELVEIFGDSIPIAAFVWLLSDPVDSGKSLKEVRTELRKMAVRPTPAADVAELVERLRRAENNIAAHGGFDEVCRATAEALADRLAAMSNRVGELTKENEALRHDVESAGSLRARLDAFRSGKHEAERRAEAAEAERDGWLKIVGDIAALVPLPSVIQATGTTGDLLNWIKQQVEGRRAAEAKLAEREAAWEETRKAVASLNNENGSLRAKLANGSLRGQFAADRQMLFEAASDPSLSDGAVRSLCLARAGVIDAETRAWAETELSTKGDAG